MMAFVNTKDPWIDYLIISRLEDAQELLKEASRLLKLLLSTTIYSGACRAYSPGTYARKDEDGLLLEFPCNPTRTRTV
jgi:hypothetical protein